MCSVRCPFRLFKGQRMDPSTVNSRGRGQNRPNISLSNPSRTAPKPPNSQGRIVMPIRVIVNRRTLPNFGSRLGGPRPEGP